MADLDTVLTRTFPYRYPISLSRLRTGRLIQHMGAWANLADATILCLHARV